MIMLFAVLTCVPDDPAPQELVAEVHRLLRPGGFLYLSDVTLQPDERIQRRYAGYADTHHTAYGVFATDDGAACRHHDVEHLRNLLADSHVADERHVEVSTINGNQTTAVQLLARRR